MHEYDLWTCQGLGYNTSLHRVLNFDAFVDGEGMCSGGGSAAVRVEGGAGIGRGLITPGRCIITNRLGFSPWGWDFQECLLGSHHSLMTLSFHAQHPDLTDTQGRIFLLVTSFFFISETI